MPNTSIIILADRRVLRITASAGTYEDTGLSVTLPSAGTFLVTADVRGFMRGFTGTSWWITAKFYNSTDNADVANSQRMVVLIDVTGVQLQQTCTLTAIITVAASKTIKLYAFRNGTGTPSWTNSSLVSDANGRTKMSYIGIK